MTPHPSPARILVIEDDESVGAVMLDLGLPDADGLDLCGEIRDRFPEMVVVVVTARATAESRPD